MIDFREKYKSFLCSILIALIIFISYAWLQDILAGEEGRVRKFILQGKRAVEAKNIFTCAELTSRDYHDKYGNDRESLLYAVKEVFGYYREILVHIESIKITLDESNTQAGVEIVALVIGRTEQNNTEKILEGEKGQLKIKLVKINKKWYLSEAESFEPITIMGQNIS